MNINDKSAARSRKRRPTCQCHLGSLHARQCAASRWSYTDSFHILLSFSLAKVHKKTGISTHLEPFSSKNTEVLERFQKYMLTLHPSMKASTDYIEDEVYGQRLLISVNADPRELQSNIRAARAILHSFAEISIIINAHTMTFGHKNPEYTIDGKLGDRKGIMGERGVTAGFKAAKKTRL